MKDDPDLLRQLETAAKRKMTPSEIWDQRVSWAFGMLPEDSTVTREEVVRISTLMHGPRPDDPSETERKLRAHLKWALGYAEYALSQRPFGAATADRTRLAKAKAILSAQPGAEEEGT